jgi:hypothetical protein
MVDETTEGGKPGVKLEAARTLSVLDALNELEGVVQPQWADERGNEVRAVVLAAIQRLRERAQAAK